MKKIAAAMLAAVTILTATAIPAANAEAATVYRNAAQVCQHVYLGYNEGTKGPITITPARLTRWGRNYNVYLVTLSGTETIKNQSTGYWTDALAGFNLNNKYLSNSVNIISANVPKGSRLILAGHSLGGMVAQQIAANSTIKNRYVVMNTVCFGSPLLAAGTREGDVKRLGDTSDAIPYASGSTLNNTVWQVAGLQRENGGYGSDLLSAHTKSYLREDVWGKYDCCGYKNGSDYLTLTGSIRYFKSPTSVK